MRDGERMKKNGGWAGPAMVFYFFSLPAGGWAAQRGVDFFFFLPFRQPNCGSEPKAVKSRRYVPRYPVGACCLKI